MDANRSRPIHPRPQDWGDVPKSDRPVWARYFIDFPPYFPGPIGMNVLARGILAGKTNVSSRWSQFAARMHAVGFSPLEYYVLRQDLSELRRDGTLDEERHADLFEVDIPAGKYNVVNPDTGELRPSPARYTIIPEGWASWPLHLRYGRTPARATQYLLTGGEPAPISVEYRGDKKVEYTD